MLTITIPPKKVFDEEIERFIELTEGQTLRLEHSLVSLSKWESIWHKPFLSKSEKTPEEIIDYVRCMTLTKNVDPDVYNNLTRGNIEQINKYIADPMTATTFGMETGKLNREQITSELIYYWMVTLGIPFECEKWHLNRLITLIRVCNIKNQPRKKMSQQELMSHNAALNAARRKQLGTKG